MKNLFSRLLLGNVSIAAIASLFLVLTACSDDNSDIVTPPSGDSSSSVCESCTDESSSSVTPQSSDCETSVSSSSRHSELDPESSSKGDGDSEATMTSSSAKSSSGAKSSSSSASQKIAWDYLNSNIDYGEMVDDRDGQTYKTVKIGDQVWMAENLNYETDSSFCYNNNESNCTKYGRLYRWAAAVGKSESECGYGKTCSLPSGIIQGVCPEGWHLPSRAEWDTLFNAVGGQSTAAKVLKSTSGWESNGNGTDAFGFSALPAGYRYSNGDYDDEGDYAYFWSSTELSSGSAYTMYLIYYGDSAYLSNRSKDYGFSVRCIKD